MRVQWISRQGRRRRSNNDAAAVGFHDGIVIAVLVDAAESRHGNGPGLARYWAQQLVTRITAEGQSDHEDLRALLREEQQALRHRYLREKASYCLVRWDRTHNEILALHTGDCQLAIHPVGDDRRPCTGLLSLQNLQSQYAAMGRDPGQVPTENQHLLTASPNARRFSEPGCYRAVLGENDAIALSTDGYPRHPESGAPEPGDDDSSLLTVSPGVLLVEQDSDCDNLLVVHK